MNTKEVWSDGGEEPPTFLGTMQFSEEDGETYLVVRYRGKVKYRGTLARVLLDLGVVQDS